MIPLSVYDQLARVGLLWLYVMLHYVWPSRGTVSPPPPVPPLLKRKRANDLTPLGPYQALYQHSCQEVQSSYNALSIKELHLHPAVGLLPQQGVKSLCVI